MGFTSSYRTHTFSQKHLPERFKIHVCGSTKTGFHRDDHALSYKVRQSRGTSLTEPWIHLSCARQRACCATFICHKVQMICALPSYQIRRLSACRSESDDNIFSKNPFYRKSGHYNKSRSHFPQLWQPRKSTIGPKNGRKAQLPLRNRMSQRHSIFKYW